MLLSEGQGARMGRIILAAAVVSGLLFTLLCDLVQKRIARRCLAGRPRRSSLEFGKEFYPDRAVVAGAVRDILAEHLPVDLSQIEPSDEPVRDLRMDALDSMAVVELVIALEEHFRIKIEDADGERMRTLDDVIRYVIAKLDEQKTGTARGDTRPPNG